MRDAAGESVTEVRATGPQVPASVSEAYDAIAQEYDRQLEDDVWMRRVLWKHYGRAFRPGHHVLDVGCGTGSDAVFLAQRGVRVTALDVSPAMIAQAESKIARYGLSDWVRLVVLDVRELASLPGPQGAGVPQFDGVISSFAALNTLPTLAQFAADAAALLRPRGRMILHLLNSSSLWEWGGLVAHGRWTEARQLGGRREKTFGVGGQPVRHYIPGADETYTRFFALHFRLCSVRGLGVTRPPCQPGYRRSGSTLRGALSGAVMAALAGLDELVASHHPFVDWGRFVMLEMERDDRQASSDLLRP